MAHALGPDPVDVSPERHLTRSLWETARDRPDRPMVAVREGDRFVDWSAQRFADEVRTTAKGLIGLGIEHGDRVCIFSGTRVEWTILDYAIWAVGAVTVPIYDTSSAEQVEWIVSDSEAVAIVIADAGLREEYDQVADRLPDCEHVVVLDDGGLEQTQGRGDGVTDDTLQARIDGVTGTDLATIVYTSGTTGRPKGCVLTHHNIVWTVAQTEKALHELLRPGKTTLLFLPLAHIFARLIQVVCIRAGVVLAFSTGLDNLQEELRMYQPTFLLAVPRVFEKVFNGAQQRAKNESAVKGRIFDRAAEVATDLSRQRAAGGASLGTRLQYGLFDRLVYGRLREAMGGRVEYAVSGGAALGERLGHFFDGIGVPVLQGYGLTETTAPATVNRPDANRIGSVGPPLPGVEIRIADDGEIEIKGGNVFQGYLKNQEATDEVLDAEGWFSSGDLGDVDDDGFLRITGRKKELIVTASGKNVAPEVLEDRLRSHPLVSQSMVVGNGKPFVAALISLDPDQLPGWAERHEKPTTKVEDLIDDPDVHDEIQQAVDRANQAVSRPERVREFRIVPKDLSVENDELTPTLKVKRNVVAEHYQHLIDDIYDGDGGGNGRRR